MLWILRTVAPWRDMPERYGKWESIATRFYRWQKAGIWNQILEHLQAITDEQGNLDWQVHYVDGTVVRALYSRRRWKKGGDEDEKLGRSRGGFSTKIHIRCEGKGKPITFLLSPGQRNIVERAINRTLVVAVVIIVARAGSGIAVDNVVTASTIEYIAVRGAVNSHLSFSLEFKDNLLSC
ncbi:IS5 family transposase [Nostoc sp.]|uniref:IS5 family transposase n=1 Tax=Nostoc sp. TaxID=1180 RepID=UPI002FF5A7EE